MGHLRVAGVADRERNPRSRERAGKLGVPTANEDDPGVENLGSTTWLSTRLSIASHSPGRGSAGEMKRSDSGSEIMTLSESDWRGRK